MDTDDLAQAIFNALDNRGCFKGIDREIREEILEEIGALIDQVEW